jgi:hypothetical protein
LGNIVAICTFCFSINGGGDWAVKPVTLKGSITTAYCREKKNETTAMGCRMDTYVDTEIRDIRGGLQAFREVDLPVEPGAAAAQSVVHRPPHRPVYLKHGIGGRVARHVARVSGSGRLDVDLPLQTHISCGGCANEFQRLRIVA